MKPEKKSKSDPAQGMRDAMKKATTEMLVLFMLRQKPMYTYQMAQEVDRLTQGVLTYNTMYLAVYRLQEGGYIQETEKRIEDGRARIYMDITSAGQEYYEKLRDEYRIFITALEKLMMPHPPYPVLKRGRLLRVMFTVWHRMFAAQLRRKVLLWWWHNWAPHRNKLLEILWKANLRRR